MPQTFYTSAAKGTGLRGVELDRCYTGPYDDQGRRHGQGTYRYPNHMVYEGNYQHGLKHGKGKLKFADGGWYEGDFEADEISGTGTRKFTNGNMYTGGFSMGEMHGQGTMTYANGDVFEGSFVKNVIQGKGIKRFSNGDVYDGDFGSNKINGHGVMQYKCGDWYDGQWQDGRRSGQGKCVFGCGDVYEGEWQADQRHGEGRLAVLIGDLLYHGTFVSDRPKQVPVKLNVLFSLPESMQSAKKAPAKGPAVEEAPPLPVTLGAPLASPITLAAVHQVPLTEQEKAAAAAAAAPPVKGAPRPAPPPPGPLAVITEPSPSDHKWETCEMESQRTVTLTLHPTPPQPLPKGSLLGLCIATVLDKETGQTKLRALFLPAKLGPPLPMSLTEDGEVIHGLQARLTSGSVVFDSLVIGSSTPESADNEALAAAEGAACMVAASWPIHPGYMKLQLPESKGKGR